MPPLLLPPPEHRKHWYAMIFLLVLVFLAFCTFLSGYFEFGTATGPDATKKTANQSVVPVEKYGPLTEVYTDTQYGLELNYPKGAVVRQNTSGSAVERVDIFYRGYLFSIFSNREASTTIMGQAEADQTLQPLFARRGIYFYRTRHATTTADGGELAFHIFGVSDSYDAHGSRVYTAKTAFRSGEGRPFDITYVLPQGVDDQTYDAAVILQFDQMLNTAIFTK